MMGESEVKILNLVKFYAICLLAERPKHGYEIIKDIGEKMEKSVSPGQIYPFLSLLEKKGMLQHGPSGKRDKKVYNLTPKGRAFEIVDIAIEPRLSVCAHCSCKVYSGGYREKVGGKKLTFCCTHCAKSFRQ
jgi:Fe2+ or Zn2+ uptake regulation protein